jgi:hypothetical protein
MVIENKNYFVGATLAVAQLPFWIRIINPGKKNCKILTLNLCNFNNNNIFKNKKVGKKCQK